MRWSVNCFVYVSAAVCFCRGVAGADLHHWPHWPHCTHTGPTVPSERRLITFDWTINKKQSAQDTFTRGACIFQLQEPVASYLRYTSLVLDIYIIYLPLAACKTVSTRLWNDWSPVWVCVCVCICNCIGCIWWMIGKWCQVPRALCLVPRACCQSYPYYALLCWTCFSFVVFTFVRSKINNKQEQQETEKLRNRETNKQSHLVLLSFLFQAKPTFNYKS